MPDPPPPQVTESSRTPGLRLVRDPLVRDLRLARDPPVRDLSPLHDPPVRDLSPVRDPPVRDPSRSPPIERTLVAEEAAALIPRLLLLHGPGVLHLILLLSWTPYNIIP